MESSKKRRDASEGSRQSRRRWMEWDSVTPIYLRYACLIWQFIKFGFQFYLCTRQRKVLLENRRIPRALLGRLPPETFHTARKYQMDRVYLEMFSCIYWSGYEYWTIVYFTYTHIWVGSSEFLARVNILPQKWDPEIGVSILFLCGLIGLSTAVELPLELYKNFVIEEKYGFNRMTYLNFFLELLKEVVVECVWGSVMAVVILWIVRSEGKFFFLWLWLFSFLWEVLTVTIYPNFIAPIFNSYTKLREGRLRTRLQRLARYLRFPLEDILVVHQKWKSNHRDAYFIGFGYSKRIIIYDTLLDGYPEADTEAEALFHRARAEQVPRQRQDDIIGIPSQILHRTDTAATRASLRATRRNRNVRRSMYDHGFNEREIEALVAELIGHWDLGHSVREMIFPQVSLFLFFIVFFFVYENSSLYEAFEVPTKMNKPIILGLIYLYLDVMDIYTLFVDQVMRYQARRREHESDLYATRLGYGEDLIEALVELNKENLGYPYYDTWYWNFHNTEPSLLHRINEIETEMRRMEWRNR